MSFVNGDEANRQALQRGQHPLRHQAFRRKIEQSDVACSHPPPDGDIRLAIPGRIDSFGSHALELQRHHLVQHQRHQRRDDDGKAAQRQRRHLITQRFAGTGRHDSEHIFACKKRRNDLLLPRPEAGKAENCTENRVRVCHCV